jgi:hypothetical protein
MAGVRLTNRRKLGTYLASGFRVERDVRSAGELSNTDTIQHRAIVVATALCSRANASTQ